MLEMRVYSDLIADDYFEKVTSEFELSMNLKGFDFITNFTPEKEKNYRLAAESIGLKYRITNEAFSGFGTSLNDGYKAFYVGSEYGDLSKFWRIYDNLKVEGDAI
jgi:hypothetical protein